MWAEIRRTKAMHEARIGPSSRRYLFVDYIQFMDELAGMIGCTPPSFCELSLLTVANRI